MKVVGFSALLTDRLMSMKNSNDPIRNQTRDLPACSAVPQPTTPPRCQTHCIDAYVISVYERS
jgi:hypothetical protein